jgi:hypothetical protein
MSDLAFLGNLGSEEDCFVRGDTTPFRIRWFTLVRHLTEQYSIDGSLRDPILLSAGLRVKDFAQSILAQMRSADAAILAKLLRRAICLPFAFARSHTDRRLMAFRHLLEQTKRFRASGGVNSLPHNTKAQMGIGLL